LRPVLIILGIALALAAAACGRDDSRRPRDRDREYRARAESAERAGELDAALTAYRDAARRFPTAAWVWVGRGRTASALGRDLEAETAFREAVRWDSTRADAWEALAGLAHDRGRADEALAWVDGALALGGETPRRRALRARILADAGRVGEAYKEVEHALAVDPASIEVHIARSFLQLRSDSTTLALVTLDGLALEHPDEPSVFEARAEVRRALGNRAAAIADLEKTLTLDANRPRARLALARLLEEEGRPGDASEQYRVLLEHSPDHPEALCGLGACSEALGDAESAQEAYERAIAATPEYAPPYLALGRSLAARGRTDEAIANLRKARARATDDPETLAEASCELAEIHLRLGEPANALEIAEALIARDPRSERGRVLRGRALAAGGGGDSSADELERIASRPDATDSEVLAWGDWLLAHRRVADARGVADRVLKVRPRHPRARVLRARALADAGLVETAESELHDLIAAPNPPAEAHLALARLYLAGGRPQDALFQAREGQGLSPDDPDLASALGEAALALGDLDAAVAAFENEKKLRPESPEPWMRLGELALRMDRPGDAADCFREARRRDADDWKASYLLGVAEDRAGRPAEAVAAYRTVLAKNERVAEAHNNLAWILADRDFDPVLAEVHARRAAELSPDDPQVLGTLGWAQYKNRMLDEAAVTLKRATGAVPGDPMKHYMLGVVQFDRGDREEALREIETALRLDPSFERAGHASELLDALGG